LVFAMCSSCFVVFNGHFLILLFVIFVMLFMVFASGGACHGFFIIFLERVGGGVQCVLLSLMYLFLMVFMVFNVVLLVFFCVLFVMFIMVFLVLLNHYLLFIIICWPSSFKFGQLPHCGLSTFFFMVFWSACSCK
jgi:hypothetical protein